MDDFNIWWNFRENIKSCNYIKIDNINDSIKFNIYSYYYVKILRYMQSNVRSILCLMYVCSVLGFLTLNCQNIFTLRNIENSLQTIKIISSNINVAWSYPYWYGHLGHVQSFLPAIFIVANYTTISISWC